MHNDDTPEDEWTDDAPCHSAASVRLTVRRVYEPDAARCVALAVFLLRPKPSDGEPSTPPVPKPKSQRKLNPSRMAKWEAHWQADAPEGDQ